MSNITHKLKKKNLQLKSNFRDFKSKEYHNYAACSWPRREQLSVQTNES